MKLHSITFSWMNSSISHHITIHLGWNITQQSIQIHNFIKKIKHWNKRHFIRPLLCKMQNDNMAPPGSTNWFFTLLLLLLLTMMKMIRVTWWLLTVMQSLILCVQIVSEPRMHWKQHSPLSSGLYNIYIPHKIFVTYVNFLRKKKVSLLELENKVMTTLAP
jgi:hypothetical protein